MERRLDGLFFSSSFSLWLQKLVLLDTYRRLHTNLRWEKVTMISYIGIFAATYVTVQIVTFTECDPFKHYWIVLPDPGMPFSLPFFSVSISPSNKFRHMLPGTAPVDRSRYVCRNGHFNTIPLTFSFLQLGVLNVITDIMLIAMPIPILVLVKRSTVE
jgi:hypothetical protein